MAEGEEPDSCEALAAIGGRREHSDKTRYEYIQFFLEGQAVQCESDELANLYDSDPRDAKNIDKHRLGLFGYMSRTIRASIPE